MGKWVLQHIKVIQVLGKLNSNQAAYAIASYFALLCSIILFNHSASVATFFNLDSKTD